MESCQARVLRLYYRLDCDRDLSNDKVILRDLVGLEDCDNFFNLKGIRELAKEKLTRFTTLEQGLDNPYMCSYIVSSQLTRYREEILHTLPFPLRFSYAWKENQKMAAFIGCLSAGTSVAIFTKRPRLGALTTACFSIPCMGLFMYK